MPGYKQVIPLRLESTPLGKFVSHPLATRPGTLLISEAQDTDSLTNIPAIGNSMLLPNAAYTTAKKLLPAGTSQEQASVRFEVTAGTTNSEVRFERTLKGGIHGIPTQSGAGVAPGHGAKLGIPDSILEYIRAHPNNRFGFGFWGRVTRKPSVPVSATGNPPQPQHFAIGRSSSKGLPVFSVSQADTLTTLYPPGSWPVPGNYEAQGGESVNQVGLWTPSYSTKWNGELQPTVKTVEGGFWWGAVGGNANNAPAMATCFASLVFYGMFIEDLTVSNITTTKFVEDFEKETNKNFSAGGRFYGDTYSDPAVAMP